MILKPNLTEVILNINTNHLLVTCIFVFICFFNLLSFPFFTNASTTHCFVLLNIIVVSKWVIIILTMLLL